MPGDLNLKKSWNPALVKNQKKVWEKEQEALKELKAIKERSKEIEQEREKEEMIRLQYGDDPNAMPHDKKIELNKLAWMYEHGPEKDKDKLNESGFREVEEDFLSKSTDVDQLIKGSVAVKKSKSNATSSFDRITNVGKSAPSSSLSDDPLLAIKREQRKRTSDTKSKDRSERHSKHRHRSSSSNRERSPSRRHRDKETDRHKHRRRYEEKPHQRRDEPRHAINY
ncbi:uncharacterized protein CXQ87_000929 [Candidozyma duobushaemuli]|uniref:Pre-mRNA-splicing factor CWC25 n=1 Tax=Candidozyma duobushaemuli TaxID=1231522 RepID=A0A2V1AJA3_9ASCO|nr:uncharacterized protein CXQ87_000929 [[Candida] duobushaemulonis]PVH18019.1 hypothetical protein CXQ87_000929 [[Candida] duobushaemulonis]